MAKLIAGVARANITPPVGMLMSGFPLRKTPAVGVHDELRCVVVYLTDGDTEATLITADLIDTDAKGTARIRAACSDVAGVPAENVFVNCSHTHGGPQTALDSSDPGDRLKQDYSAVLVYKLAGALMEAKRRAVAVRFGHGRRNCTVAVNRRERKPDGTIVLGVNPNGPTAPFTDVMRMDRVDTGEPMALLFCYACHGTTLQSDNYLYTADYPGAARSFVDGQVPTAASAFLAGCSGDTNAHPRGKYEHRERHGLALGCAVVQAAMEIMEMTGDAPLAVARHQFALPVDPPPSLEEARKSPFARTLPVSHANGAPGYLPTADQIPLGGYEIERSRASKYGLHIVPESDRIMMEGALAALQRCYDFLHG